MRPARFVTCCFLYCGALLAAIQIVTYQPGRSIGAIVNGSVALCVLATGLYRLSSDSGEERPDEYGLLSYGMALLSLVVTGIFVAGVSLAL
ncbi:hypothetical protein ACNS7O_12020 [Haloferacaceae archaeon DSL9]